MTVHVAVFNPKDYDITAVGRSGSRADALAREHSADYAINFPFYIGATGAAIGPNVVSNESRFLTEDIVKARGRHGFYRKDGEYRIGPRPDNPDFFVQGSPVMLENGAVVVHPSIYRDQLDSSVFVRAQRTAIGIRADGSVVFVVADGRREDFAGFTLSELAEYMRDNLGCMQAINGDGGGSSTFYSTASSGIISPRPVGCAVIAKRKDGITMNVPKYEDIRRTIRRVGEYAKVPLSERTEIAIHHSLTTGGDAHSFANYHIDTHGWPGCAYAFVILKNGTIQHANDIDRMTYHVGNSNRFAVGVCLVGDFRTERPTEAQKVALKALHDELVRALPNYKRTRGHNEYPGYAWKDCPCFDYESVINPKEDDDIVQGEATVKVGDKQAAGYIIDGATYVPIRFVTEALGGRISWDNKTKTATITKEAK